MSRKKLVEYVKHPAMLDGISEDELREWIREFPYSQNLRLLLAKKIKQRTDADGDESFIDAAMYSTDRIKLYDALNNSGKREDEDFRKEESTAVENLEPTPQMEVSDSLLVTDLEGEDLPGSKIDEVKGKSDEIQVKDEDQTPDQTELDPDPPEYISRTEIDTAEISTNFNGNGVVEEDQQVSDQTDPDNETEELLKTDYSEITSTALSDFSHWLLTLPQIHVDPGTNKISEIDQTDYNADHEPVSASLAELLTTQGHYERAISMYQKLQLIYPEKSAYFAAQIQKLKAT